MDSRKGGVLYSLVDETVFLGWEGIRAFAAPFPVSFPSLLFLDNNLPLPFSTKLTVTHLFIHLEDSMV